MEHLDPDLTFPSAEMESLDFTTEEGGVSSSCLLHILPPDSAYNQGAGLDLHEYTATLSPSMSLAGLEETVLPSEVSVSEGFETPDSIAINIPQTTKVTQVDTGDQRTLLDVSLFNGDQDREVESTNTIEELRTVTLDTQASGDDPSMTSEILRNVSGAYLLAQQQPFTVVGSRNISSKPIVTSNALCKSTVQPLLGLCDMNTVAPNVFLASADPKVNLHNYSQHFSSKKISKVRGKKAVSRAPAPLTAAATKGSEEQKNIVNSISLQQTDMPLESREIRVELTQVSNETTIVRLSFVPGEATDSESTNHDLVLSPEVLSSLLMDNGFQDISIEPKQSTEMGESSAVEGASSDLVNTINQGEASVLNTVGLQTLYSSDDEEDNKPLLKVREEMAQQEKSDEMESALQENPATCATYVMDKMDELDPSEQNISNNDSQPESSSVDNEGSKQTNAEQTNQSTSVDWGALEDMSLENAEAEMASLLAESKLKMKTLARLDEIMIQITDSQCRVVDGKGRWCCDKCDKSYTTKNNLVVHTLGHNGIKPHVCMVCKRTFSQQSHLKTHILTHGNIRPHACKVCHRTFTQVN